MLDYTQPLPQDLKEAFDIVFDCHGGLTSEEENFLLKRSGLAVNIDPTAGNVIRSLISTIHRFVRGVPSTSILRRLVDLATAGQFDIPISRTASLSQAIPMISDLEAGSRVLGKAVITMG